MRAVDTNILVRLIARDDPNQLSAARAIIAAGNILLLPTVLLETEWVLRARYGMTRGQIAQGLSIVCGQTGVVTSSASAVASAIASYSAAGDFADLLHLALAAENGAESFVTFDRKFPHSEDAGLAVEIV